MFIDVRYMILFIGECYIVEKFMYVFNLIKFFFFVEVVIKIIFFIYEVRICMLNWYVMFI